MSCERIDLAELYDLADDRIDEPRRLAIESHVNQCADCREALRDVRRIADRLSGIQFESAEAGPDLRGHVMESAEALLLRLRTEAGRDRRHAAGAPAFADGASGP